MALSSTNPDIKKGLLIDKFLRNFKQHEYVWLAWNAASHPNYSPRHLLDFFNEKHSFDYLRDYIKSTLSNFEEDDINIFINNCHQKNKEYILNINIELFLNDNRLCWFLINRFLDNYNILLTTKERIYKRLNNSEKNDHINNYYRIHTKTNNPKSHKYINNPKIFILALIYLNPKITNKPYQRNIDLENYITEFNEIKKERINLNKYINDKEFTKWSKDYIDKYFKYTVFPKFRFEQDNLHQEYIYAYFDDLYINNKEKYINDLNKLKKAWQQNVFRIKNKDNTKKSYHLPLKKGSKKLLEELALFKNISESEVLEILIKEAYKNEMCDKKGKAIY
jgi:hypothetical protein